MMPAATLGIEDPEPRAGRPVRVVIGANGDVPPCCR